MNSEALSKLLNMGFRKMRLNRMLTSFKRIWRMKKVIEVGVNEFRTDTEENYKLFKLDNDVRIRQIEKLEKLEEEERIMTG